MNELREHRVNDSEIDLFQVMAIIWEKKKQILSYTVLIVVGAVLFSYFQPKYYETKMVALVLPSQGDAFSSKHSLPLEYYEQFSKSPEILKAVLERLPSEVKFEDNISPLDYLMLMHLLLSFQYGPLQLKSEGCWHQFGVCNCCTQMDH